MAKRHGFRPGDWDSVASRLDEIISAHSGEDPFEEALKLLVAKLAHEVACPADERFPGPGDEDATVAHVNRLLGVAAARWSGIVDRGEATRLSGPELLRCAAVLASVRLLADDLVGLDAIFEFMVNKAAKGQKGQYFTPRHVIAAIVEIVGPAPGEQVVDPACGSGGFLRHALRACPDCSAWGFDQDAKAVRVARVMMAASGQPASRVMRVDSLRRPGGTGFPGAAPGIEDLARAQDPRVRGFDVVLTNPPFAGDVGTQFSGAYVLARGRHVERDILFLERCLELLRPGGRFGIVLPFNKVGGAAWSHAREWLLEQARVLAVIGLGRNTFLPHTSQKACVLIGQKRPQTTRDYREEEVLFFISDRDGKDRRGRLQYRGDLQAVDHDLDEAVRPMRARVEAACGAAR